MSVAAQETQPMVAFLGPAASYTHQATINLFPQATTSQIIPQTSIEDVFVAVQSAAASHGVVPFENSSNGSVVFTLDLLADLDGKCPDILVTGEVYVPVHHCLVGRRPTTDSDSPPDLAHVRKVYSHPQAWGQCKQVLAARLKGVERQDVSSTSRAAEIAATEPAAAAISSRLAADLNGLDVLAEGIQDNASNSTRFLVLQRRRGRRPAVPREQQSSVAEDGDHAAAGEAHAAAADAERYKTLVSFTVEHGAPGALAACLAAFERHGLNLTSINTRPSGEAAWHYIFFVEFHGRRRHGGEERRRPGDGGAVNEALEDLTRCSKSWRWLGSWEDRLGC